MFDDVSGNDAKIIVNEEEIEIPDLIISIEHMPYCK